MASLIPGAFSSSQFIFVVGESRREFPVHSAIVAKQSEALNALITGPMVEAFDGRAVFKDTGEDTFERFCQFAYTGDYSTAESVLDSSVKLEEDPVSEPAEAPAPSIVPEELDEEVQSYWGGKGTSKKGSKSRRLRQSLDGLLYHIDGIRTNFKDRCEVRQNTSPTEDYTPVLLGHAHLYVFAENKVSSN